MFHVYPRLEEKVGVSNSRLLSKLSHFYQLKTIDCGNSSVWKRDDVLVWLFDTLQCFFEELHTDEDVQQVE